MEVVVVGLSHKTAGVEVREQVALGPAQHAERLQVALATPGVAEAFLLNTCNRSELYLVGSNGHAVAEPEAVFASVHRASLEAVRDHLYVLRDAEAVRHMCAVASGIDSMVVGEHEIVDQLKSALDQARDAGSVRSTLMRLAERALATGKRARTETEIGHGFLSVASVAVKLAQDVFGDLARARVLVLGAGQNSELVVDRLREAGASSVIVSSRRFERAVELAERFGGRPVRFDAMLEELTQADIVIASTHAPHPMITAEQVRAVIGTGRERPMFVIDLSVPRNVDAAVRQVPGVHLYDLDSLNEFIDSALAQRHSEVPKVREIVEQEAREFIVWAKSRELVPLTLAILDRADELREEEYREFLASGRTLSPKEEKAVERLTRRIVHRLLRGPLDRLRELTCTPEGVHNLDMARYLFGVEGELALEDDPPAGA